MKPYGGLHRIFKHRYEKVRIWFRLYCLFIDCWNFGVCRAVAKLGMVDYSGAVEDISQALALAPNYYEVILRDVALLMFILESLLLVLFLCTSPTFAKVMFTLLKVNTISPRSHT